MGGDFLWVYHIFALMLFMPLNSIFTEQFSPLSCWYKQEHQEVIISLEIFLF